MGVNGDLYGEKVFIKKKISFLKKEKEIVKSYVVNEVVNNFFKVNSDYYLFNVLLVDSNV